MQRLILLISLLSLSLIACTENQRARSFGGTQRVTLPANTKLVSATWKHDSLYTLTRPMRENEVAEEHTFQEYSSFGILQGTVIIVEKRE